MDKLDDVPFQIFDDNGELDEYIQKVRDNEQMIVLKMLKKEKLEPELLMSA